MVQQQSGTGSSRVKKSQQKYWARWEAIAEQLMSLSKGGRGRKALRIHNPEAFHSIIAQATVVARQLGEDIQGGTKTNDYLQGRLGYLYGLMAAATHVASNLTLDLLHPRALD